MTFRRDGITSNVEVMGDIEEILERQGEAYQLEDLKYHDGNPARQREVLQKWISKQEYWLDKLPNLMKEIQEGLQTRVTTDQLKAYLQEVNARLEVDLNNTLVYLDTTDELPSDQQKPLKEQVLEALRKLQERRSRIAQEMASQTPDIADLIKNNGITAQLEKQGVTVEASLQPDEL